MKNFKKYKCFVLLILVTMSSVSCSDWLDVSPKSEIEESEIFKTTGGFQDVLVGNYILLQDTKLYGYDLPITNLEIMAQQFDVNVQQSAWMNLAIHDYELAEGQISLVWNGMYNVIANCNSLINNIEHSSINFKDQYYEVILGESLAMRAWLHFDLMKLFHPSYVSSTTFKGMPYVTEFKVDPTKSSSSEQLMENILDDLERAKAFLKDNDPLITGEDFDEEFLQNREHRLNYYAVCGILARVYLYKGDKVNALINANEIITSTSYPLVDEFDIEVNKDYTFDQEFIFSVDNDKLSTNFFKNFNLQSLNTSSILYSHKGTSDLFQGEDIRFKNWFTSNVSGKNLLQKYLRNDEDEYKYNSAMPILKIGEIYLIAAECTADVDLPQSFEFLNLLRRNRNALEFDGEQTISNLNDELLTEYRREFVGEGQLFYFYKRLNYPVMYVGDEPSVLMDDESYTFPIPKAEIQFGGRN